MFIAKQSQFYESRRYLININKQYYVNQNRNIKYFNQNDRFSLKQSNTYQNDSKKQNIRTSHVEITTKLKNSKIESKERESDRSRYDNRYDNKYDDRYDSRDEYKKKSKSKRKEYNDERNKDKFKIKIYLTQENNDESDDNDNVCHEKKLNYFDSDYDEIDDSENTILINNAAFIDIACRRCHRNFSFNNQLHKHLRTDICRKKAFSIKANVFVNDHNISLIRFKINCYVPHIDIGTRYAPPM